MNLENLIDVFFLISPQTHQMALSTILKYSPKAIER
jgi:hypothetical protein